jgi:hypothetical protein
MADASWLLSGWNRIQWVPEYLIAVKLMLLVVVPLFLYDLLNERSGGEHALEKARFGVQLAGVVALLAVVLLMSGSGANAFIYFQF